MANSGTQNYYDHGANPKYYEYAKKKQMNTRFSGLNSFNNKRLSEKPFLEQHLDLYKPSILQKNGISLTHNVTPTNENTYGGANLSDRYEKLRGQNDLKPQQRLSHQPATFAMEASKVYGSPAPLSGMSLLETYQKIKTPYPPTNMYRSPQRNYSKVGKLLDPSPTQTGLTAVVTPPTYKFRQGPYTSMPRKPTQLTNSYLNINSNNTFKAKTSHAMVSAPSYDRRY